MRKANHDWTEEATRLARHICESDTWDADQLRRLCEMAGLAEQWDAADGETFEDVAQRAADILGVYIF